MKSIISLSLAIALGVAVSLHAESRNSAVDSPANSRTIRVNPDVDAKSHAKISTGKSDNKFGITYLRASEVYARAAALPNIDADFVPVGTHSCCPRIRPRRSAPASA